MCLPERDMKIKIEVTINITDLAALKEYVSDVTGDTETVREYVKSFCETAAICNLESALAANGYHKVID